MQTDILKHMVQIDGHSERVARRVYAIVRPEDDVAVAQKLFQVVCGAPVDWPSSEQVDADNIKIDDMLKDVANSQDEVTEELPDDDEHFVMFVNDRVLPTVVLLRAVSSSC
jgi:hypothetical protein